MQNLGTRTHQAQTFIALGNKIIKIICRWEITIANEYKKETLVLEILEIFFFIRKFGMNQLLMKEKVGIQRYND